MTAAGWVVAVDKLIETGQIFITDCDANFAVGTMILSGCYYVPSGPEKKLEHLRELCTIIECHALVFVLV